MRPLVCLNLVITMASSMTLGGCIGVADGFTRLKPLIVEGKVEDRHGVPSPGKTVSVMEVPPYANQNTITAALNNEKPEQSIQTTDVEGRFSHTFPEHRKHCSSAVVVLGPVFLSVPPQSRRTDRGVLVRALDESQHVASAHLILVHRNAAHVWVCGNEGTPPRRLTKTPGVQQAVRASIKRDEQQDTLSLILSIP
ncbi:MAG: hypothetical protein HZB26_02665 [Candidatus Hydrogenedentes bacterium]|nr:hypothetical protein [Candidatus Hydrogenedentota bacterium]